MAYSKVILNGTTLMDVTDKTVEANNMLTGYTALKNDGTNVTGTYEPQTVNLQAKSNIAPTTSSQTITPDTGYDGLSSVQINAMPTGTAGTPSATKGTVSNHAVSVTPSVTNTTGYITGGTKAGTAVSVTASELVSGTKSITENGIADVTNYASVDVNVSGGGGGAGLRLAWAYVVGSWTSIGNSNWTKTVTINGVTDDDFVQCFPAPSNNTNGRLVSVYTHTSNSVTLVYHTTSSSVSSNSTFIFAIMEASADIAYACGSTYGLTQTTFTPGDTVTYTNTATGAQRVIVTINRMTTGGTLTSATLDYGQTLTFTMPKGGVFIKTVSTGGGND